MKIRWFGHSCYQITTAQGTRILTDPFNEKVGYPLPEVEADIVTVSHGHGDHNNTAIVQGDFTVLDTPGQRTVKGVEILGVAAYHDKNQGAERGKNTLFKISADGVSVLHCGDLGHLLDEHTAAEVGHVDVLLVPVGGHFTIDAAEAAQVVRRLKPTLTIPMHYKTQWIGFPISDETPFLQQINGRRQGAAEVEVTAENIAGLAGVLVLEL